jgi:hypothetical protein
MADGRKGVCVCVCAGVRVVGGGWRVVDGLPAACMEGLALGGGRCRWLVNFETRHPQNQTPNAIQTTTIKH